MSICHLFTDYPSYVSVKRAYVEREKDSGDYGRYIIFFQRVNSMLGDSGGGMGRGTDVWLIIVVLNRRTDVWLIIVV
jgi:hypothetical protein